MRIALVVHDYHQHGGHSRYVAELAARFAAEHEVHVFANRIETGPNSPLRFHHVPAWRATALSTVLSFPLAATRAVGSGFDIVHAQGVSVLRPDVMTAHICNRAWHEARRQLGNLTWKDYLFDGVVGPCERLSMNGKNSPWMIAISERVRQDLARCYQRSQRVTVIPHAVTAGRFAPLDQARLREQTRARLRLSELDTAFLFVGDLRKGAAAAIECLRRVPNMRLICVSHSAPEPYRKTAERLGVAGRLILCPPTTAIEEYYAAADAFLFPTPYDAFGMVITEAMAAGLPVITTRAAGASEWITHNEDGFLVNTPRDVDTMSGFAAMLVENAELRRKVGAMAQKRTKSWTWDNVASETMAVYRQVLEQRRSS